MIWRKKRCLVILALVGGAAASGLVWLRPWADSVMTVAVTVRTDERPPVLVYQARRLVREGAAKLPVLQAEIDLTPWAGRLVQIAVRGDLSRRLQDGTTGYVGCAAELVSGERSRAIEFVGWRQHADCEFHPGPVGTQAFRGGGREGTSFAFATKGNLWHVLRVPEQAKARLKMRPVPAARLEGALEPCLAEAPAERSHFRLPGGRRAAPPPDIFIYLVDTLRADHLGCYGYARGTSPSIDAFAAEAALYENAHTPATWTRPSVASLLTGLYPSVHTAMSELDMLPEWPVLLSEILSDAGYRSTGIVTNPHIHAELGFDQGWHELTYRNATAAWVNRTAEGSLALAQPGQPVLMYLHTREPHLPYTPSSEVFRMFDRGIEGRCDGTRETLREVSFPHPDLSETDYAHLIDLYDAEVFEADLGFAAFLDILKQTGRYDDSLIVFTSDHGEAFGEHRTFTHGWDLNQETMRIPLIVRFPGGELAGVRVRQPVSLIDVLPTVLATLRLRPPLPYELPGTDLVRVTGSAQNGAVRRIFAEVAKWDNNDLDLVAVIDEDGYKRVVDVSVPPRETATPESLGLWDTRGDPGEAVDIAEKLPVRAAYGEQLMAQWLLEQQDWGGRGSSAQQATGISERLKRHMRALGYLR